MEPFEGASSLWDACVCWGGAWSLSWLESRFLLAMLLPSGVAPRMWQVLALIEHPCSQTVIVFGSLCSYFTQLMWQKAPEFESLFLFFLFIIQQTDFLLTGDDSQSLYFLKKLIVLSDQLDIPRDLRE